jgi:hypothetical protein
MPEPRRSNLHSGLVEWLLTCPEKGSFVAIESEATAESERVGTAASEPEPENSEDR